jgi:hypothetical protein
VGLAPRPVCSLRANDSAAVSPLPPGVFRRGSSWLVAYAGRETPSLETALAPARHVASSRAPPVAHNTKKGYDGAGMRLGLTCLPRPRGSGSRNGYARLGSIALSGRWPDSGHRPPVGLSAPCATDGGDGAPRRGDSGNGEVGRPVPCPAFGREALLSGIGLIQRPGAALSIGGAQVRPGAESKACGR